MDYETIKAAMALYEERERLEATLANAQLRLKELSEQWESLDKGVKLMFEKGAKLAIAAEG